jgi:hypothetical protein
MIAPDPFKFPFLQDAKQRNLSLRGKIADFI